MVVDVLSKLFDKKRNKNPAPEEQITPLTSAIKSWISTFNFREGTGGRSQSTTSIYHY